MAKDEDTTTPDPGAGPEAMVAATDPDTTGKHVIKESELVRAGSTADVQYPGPDVAIVPADDKTEDDR